MKKTNKVLSWLLVFAMVLGIFPFDARANDSEANSVTILFRAQKDGAFLFNQQEITVTDGLAEEYGYTVAAEDHNKEAVGGPTVFDALVAVHKAKYGDDFTKETAGDYLQISSGTLTRAFGQSATSTGYFVNGEMPNDGIAGDHGTTGYMIDTAVLASNDNVDFWFYQDNYWTDYYTFFTETEKTVSAGESFTLTLEGFMALSAMGYEPEAEAINGEDGYITIHSVKPDGSLSEALTDADGEALLIDANGQVTLSFEEAGTYLITANGMEGDFLCPDYSALV